MPSSCSKLKYRLSRSQPRTLLGSGRHVLGIFSRCLWTSVVQIHPRMQETRYLTLYLLIPHQFVTMSFHDTYGIPVPTGISMIFQIFLGVYKIKFLQIVKCARVLYTVMHTSLHYDRRNVVHADTSLHTDPEKVTTVEIHKLLGADTQIGGGVKNCRKTKR